MEDEDFVAWPHVQAVFRKACGEEYVPSKLVLAESQPMLGKTTPLTPEAELQRILYLAMSASKVR